MESVPHPLIPITKNFRSLPPETSQLFAVSQSGKYTPRAGPGYRSRLSPVLLRYTVPPVAVSQGGRSRRQKFLQTGDSAHLSDLSKNLPSFFPALRAAYSLRQPPPSGIDAIRC